MTKLAPHILRTTGDDYSVFPAAKFVGDWGGAMALPGEMLIIGRLCSDQDAQWQRKQGLSPRKAAEQFIKWQKPTYDSNPHIIYWEGHNEPVFDREGMAWYAQFEIERMSLMSDLGLRCVVGNFATGCPSDLTLWEPFMPAIEEMEQHGALLGLHEYSSPYMWWMTGAFQVDPTEDEGDEGWTTLRYRKVYRQFFEPAGLGDTPLVITECGLDPLAAVNKVRPGMKIGTWLSLGDYWREQDGETSKADFYFRQLQWYDLELQKDPYVLAAFIYCYGNFGKPWSEFDVAGTAVAEKLEAYARQDPHVPPVIEPTPEPVEQWASVGNPGFNQDWGLSRSHEALRFSPAGTFETVQVGNIFTPPNRWKTWFVHGKDIRSGEECDFAQPEVTDMHVTAYPERVYEKSRSMRFFTTGRSHDGGFLQRVSVRPGWRVRVRAKAHAWSNSGSWSSPPSPHPSDGAWSEGPGRQPGFLLEGEAPDDDWRNFTFRLGIHPKGGLDILSDEVVWGLGAHIYNVYASIPEVVTTAESDEVTIVLRSTALWRFKHQDAYFDYVEVDLLPPSDDEPAEEPSPDYKAFVLVPPQDCSEDDWVAISRQAHNANGVILLRSMVASHDDVAAIIKEAGGDGTVILYEIEKGSEGDYVAWHKARNPNVKVEFRYLHALKDAITLYSQTDPRWKDQIYSGTKTFGQAGCYVTAVAMMASLAGYSDDPPEVARKLREAGVFSGALLTRPDRIPDAYPKLVWYGRYDWRKVSAKLEILRAWLKYGPVIIETEFRPGGVQPPTDQHFVVAEKITPDGKDLIILDPWDGTRVPLLQRYALDDWDLTRAIYGVRMLLPEIQDLDTPEPADPEVKSHPIVGLHDLSGGDWMRDKGIKGWCTIPVYLSGGPQWLNLQYLADAGIRVIANLRWSYATDDGGQGTLPLSAAKQDQFLDYIDQTVRGSSGLYAVCLCNEPNNIREGGITPDAYAAFYNRVHDRLGGSVRLGPCAIDPYNPGWGDWRVTWRQVLDQLDGLDMVFLHAYTHDSDTNRILSTQEFSHDPLRGVYYDMRVLENQLAILPARFKDKPVVVTETNHWVKRDGSLGWDDDAGEWARQAFQYLGQYADGVCLFRFSGDRHWRIDDKPQILSQLQGVADES